MLLQDDLFRFLWIILQFISQILLQLHMEWETSADSRWCERNMFYLPIISASATGAFWCKSDPEILPSSPPASSVPWQITLFMKCQADTSSYLETECLQFSRWCTSTLLNWDRWMFIHLFRRKRLKCFLTQLLVEYFRLHLTGNDWIATVNHKFGHTDC